MKQVKEVNELDELVTKGLLYGFIDNHTNLIWKHREEAQELEKTFNSHLVFQYKKIVELQEQVEQLTQQRERFQHNLMYIGVVEDIITSTETEWDSKTFNNMLVKLVGKDEVYKVFVSTTNAPVIGNTIHFIFNADENKLSKLKVI